MLKRLMRKLRKGDLLLLDNGFYSFQLLKLLVERGCNGTLLMRLVYIYRKGFRRRRILTSLIDAETYPSSDIAALYHRRWDIETFYGDFKTTMQACKWHCQSPDTFEKELAMHMIAFVLIRTTMLEAARKRGAQPARLSFSRALTEARIFWKPKDMHKSRPAYQRVSGLLICAFSNSWNEEGPFFQ